MPDFSFTEEQELLRKTVREFCEKNLTPKAREIDEKREIPNEVIKGMANPGLLAMTVSPDYSGAGDMNVLGNALKTPVVTYGPGDSSLNHTPNEYIGIQEYLDSIQVYREAIIRLVELHKKGK